jgi:hypothetical protein
LTGNEQIWAVVRRSFAQVTSRFGAPLVITGPTAADLDACIRAWHEHLCLGEVAPDTRDFLRTIGLKPGALRNIQQTYRFGAFLAAGQGVPVSLDILRASWAAIGEKR